MSAAPTTRAVIGAMTDEHAEQVSDIYRLGIATGHATFETEPPTRQQFTAARLAEHRYVWLST
jgi:phosphinothricin acetyltransferase